MRIIIEHKETKMLFEDSANQPYSALGHDKTVERFKTFADICFSEFKVLLSEVNK